MTGDSRHTKVLGDFVRLRRGTTYKSRLLGSQGPVLLGLASIERNGGFRDDSLRNYAGDSPAALTLGPGDLYVSLKDVTQSGDLLGAVARVPPSVTAGRLTQDTVRLDLVDGAPDAAYIYWLLRTPEYRDYCRARANGTTNLSLGREDFLAFPVAPPTTAQQSLIALLEVIETKIELNRYMSRTLQALVLVVFKSWFIDFDPVQWNSEEPKTLLEGWLADLYGDCFAESEFGRAPSGWHVLTLGDVLTESRERVGSRDVPEYSSTNMGLQPRAERYAKSLSASPSKNKLVRRGWLVFGLSRRVLNFGLMKDEVGSVSPAYKVYQVDAETIEPSLLERMLRSSPDYYYNALASSSREGQSVSRDALERLSFVLPPRPVQSAFCELVNPIHEMRERVSRENGILSETRETLLSCLLNARSDGADCASVADLGGSSA